MGRRSSRRMDPSRKVRPRRVRWRRRDAAVGVATPARTSSAANSDDPSNLSTVRFVRRGSARAWISSTDTPPLGENAQRALDALQRDGASFFDELLTSSTLTTRGLRDALRELAGAGLVTN